MFSYNVFYRSSAASESSGAQSCPLHPVTETVNLLKMLHEQ